MVLLPYQHSKLATRLNGCGEFVCMGDNIIGLYAPKLWPKISKPEQEIIQTVIGAPKASVGENSTKNIVLDPIIERIQKQMRTSAKEYPGMNLCTRT